MTPSRPYILRALFDWIVDNHCTPYLQVDTTFHGVSVPEKYVKDGKIILNISSEAVVNLSLGNEWVNFEARFSGVSHIIRLPVMSIQAIYASENGRGMVFNHEPDETPSPPDSSPKISNRPVLKVIK